MRYLRMKSERTAYSILMTDAPFLPNMEFSSGWIRKKDEISFK